MTENTTKIKAVVFDLDGTLVNTAADLAAAMNYALNLNSRPERSIDDCAAMIGNGVKKFAQRALTSEFEHLTEKVTKEMMARYLDHCTEKTTVYEGIHHLIDNLKASGISIAVLTNKDQPAADAIIAHYFPNTFDYVVGTTSGNAVKPDPGAFLKLLEEMNIAPENTLMVGDSQPDVQVAIAASATPIAVTWGFRTADQLRQAGAKIVVNTPKEIMNFIH